MLHKMNVFEKHKPLIEKLFKLEHLSFPGHWKGMAVNVAVLPKTSFTTSVVCLQSGKNLAWY